MATSVNKGGWNITEFLKQHGSKLTAVLFWLLLLGGYWFYTRQGNGDGDRSLFQLAEFITGSFWGGLIYIGVYILRPLIFFPATLLTILGGFLFGPVWGVVYTIIGSNSSAMLAYVVGRYFGNGVLDSDEGEGLLQRYKQRLQDNSFESVLIMRLLFLPYDLVHYIAGFLQIDWKAFLLATALGAIPGTISFVLLGTSFGTLMALMEGEIEVNPWSIALSVGIILVSLIISRVLRRRESVPTE